MHRPTYIDIWSIYFNLTKPDIIIDWVERVNDRSRKALKYNFVWYLLQRLICASLNGYVEFYSIIILYSAPGYSRAPDRCWLIPVSYSVSCSSAQVSSQRPGEALAKLTSLRWILNNDQCSDSTQKGSSVLSSPPTQGKTTFLIKCGHDLSVSSRNLLLFEKNRRTRTDCHSLLRGMEQHLTHNISRFGLHS